MRVYAWIVAVILVAIHTTIGVLLRIAATGVYFRVSDQVALVLLGLIFGGLALLFARPRLRVLDEGLGVRNLFAEKLVPWGQVVSVSFPESSPWARVDIPDDEFVPTMAISAIDGQYALDSIRALRAEVDQHIGSASQ
ncbi:MAG: PH domain-containing protein [Segniliparus sp.]|uniref:PH domain-containing protein n=1 Tax=Segniliparus sp. TaxID=2804064 RepID=UPI003F36D2C8